MRVIRYAIALLAAATSVAEASSLRVSPILLDVSAPGASTMLTLHNDGAERVNVQIRVFRWTGTKGDPILEPTDSVVVSPPAAALAAGTDYVVRVVRVSKQPVVDEESYRILVDEIPEAGRGQASSVRFALRYSIPVFFAAANAEPAKIKWSIQEKGVSAVLTATNAGGRRVRIANLKLTDGLGEVVLKQPGLVGYALGRSATGWTLPVSLPAARRGPVRLLADSETGVIDAAVVVQPAR
ncbi:MAG TPA: molecular chaperone [Rhodopseudomonas sp.]|uniref:fimbrial biogenesis chaperone n=1 Tax=Rhodopseudomonas sp. TaxID=1078 RepID=UPI002EDA9633